MEESFELSIDNWFYVVVMEIAINLLNAKSFNNPEEFEPRVY